MNYLGPRQREVVDALHAAHAAGRPGIPLAELRLRFDLRGWGTLERLRWRGLIWWDARAPQFVFLQARRPLLPALLPANVVRLRRP